MNLVKFLLALLGATTCLAASQHEYVCLNDGISLETQKGKVKLQVISDDIVRVITSPINTFSDRKSLVIQKSVNTPEFDIIEDENVLQVKTSQLIVSVERENGKVVFKDIYGKILL